MQICATRDNSGFRGPETIELTIDPDTKLVTRAALNFGGPKEGGALANRASNHSMRQPGANSRSTSRIS